MLLPELRTELSAQRSRDLLLAGCRERLARAAANTGSTRQRLGRRLISIGTKLAGDAALTDHTFISG
jgi:hypothetical protein